MSTAPDEAEVRKLVVRGLAEVPDQVGRTFQGSWFSIEADRIRLFDIATYTVENTGVVDEASYPDGLVEGFHLLGLLDHLLDEVFTVADEFVYPLNYGLNSVRFIEPVTVDRPIRLRGEVRGVTPKGGGQLVELGCSVELQGAPRPAFVADFLVLWLPAER